MANFAQQMGALSAGSNSTKADETRHKLLDYRTRIINDLQGQIKAKAEAGVTSLQWETPWFSIAGLVGPELKEKQICEYLANLLDKAIIQLGFNKFEVRYDIQKTVPDKPPGLYAMFRFRVNWASEEKQMQDTRHLYEIHPARLPEFADLVDMININGYCDHEGGPIRPWAVKDVFEVMSGYYDLAKKHGGMQPWYLFGATLDGKPMYPGKQSDFKNGVFIMACFDDPLFDDPIMDKGAGKGGKTGDAKGHAPRAVEKGGKGGTAVDTKGAAPPAGGKGGKGGQDVVRMKDYSRGKGYTIVFAKDGLGRSGRLPAKCSLANDWIINYTCGWFACHM